MERDFQESGRKSRGDREMNLNDLLGRRPQGAGQDREVRARTVGELTANMLATGSGSLLDRARRHEILGHRAAPRRAVARAAQFLAEQVPTATAEGRAGRSKQAGYQEKIRDNYQAKENRYLVEFHKKFAIPFACVVFALLGVPMAVTTSRSGKGISVSLAIAVYLVYYLFLVGGEKFADRGLLDPFLAMWAANFVLLASGSPCS